MSNIINPSMFQPLPPTTITNNCERIYDSVFLGNIKKYAEIHSQQPITLTTSLDFNYDKSGSNRIWHQYTHVHVSSST